MRKNSLSTTGLSMSQAQTISNLCYQSAITIVNNINQINNAGKSLEYQSRTHQQVAPVKMPADIKDQVLDIGRYSACQAFLMENIKAKDEMLQSLKSKRFVSANIAPEHPDLRTIAYLSPVDENWGWEQLSAKELADYYENESMASHIGKFIHKGGKLDFLRAELPTISALEWYRVNPITGETLPVSVAVHHTTQELWSIHESLAASHREYEQKVNYYKSKTKNAVTEENARIASENGTKQGQLNKENGLLMDEYNKELAEYRGQIMQEQEKWEKERHQEISKAAALRIEVEPRFQAIINKFLPKVDDK